ncbi:MAG TPA: ROK family protein [Pirellulales bacterium]|nr:ROK family protein [Pirellulales bacterium]
MNHGERAMSGRLAIGIDIGGTKIAVASVDPSGRILTRESIATEAELGFERAVARMVETIERVLKQAGAAASELCGVGVGCAGPVNPLRGVINNPYTLPTWNECDIVAALGKSLGLPVFLENDADSAAIGEWYAGAARGAERIVMLTLGTGVGGGVVLDGQVYRGVQGEHPELGHIPIDPTGPECYCGTRGCLESIASGTALADAGAAFGYADSREVFAAAAAGDAGARAIVERAQRAVAFAGWTILHTFMPELIVLGGGIAEEHFERFAAGIAEQIPRATMVPPGAVRVVRAALGNEAGLVGAASLALARGKMLQQPAANRKPDQK